MATTKRIFRSIEHYKRWKLAQLEKAYFEQVREALKGTKTTAA